MIPKFDNLFGGEVGGFLRSLVGLVGLLFLLFLLSGNRNRFLFIGSSPISGRFGKPMLFLVIHLLHPLRMVDL